MFRFFSIFAAVILLLSPAALAQGKPVVKIGITTVLTGDNAHLGESMRDAMIMAKENLPADTKYDYQLIFEDDALDAKKAALAVNKMVSVDKVDVLSSFSSGIGGVVSPVAEQNKIIHINVGASAQSVADGDYNFIHWTPPSEEVRVMAEELPKRGIKKLAVIVINQQGFLAMNDQMKEMLTPLGVEMVSENIVNPGEKDFRTILAKAKEANPDLFVLLLFSPELEIAAKQIREAGISAPVTSIESFGLSSEPQLFEGQWYIDAAAGNSEFNDKFKARFNRDAQLGAPNAYDVINMVERAYEKAPAPPGVKPSPENVAKELMGMKDYEGAMGKIHVDDNGVFISKAAVKTIKDGKPALLAE